MSTVSNAFFRPIKTPIVFWHVFIADLTFSTNAVNAYEVE